MNLQAKNKLSPKVRDIVDFFEEKLGDEVEIVEPNIFKSVITGVNESSEVIGGFVFNQNIDDSIQFDLKIIDNQAKIILRSRPYPMTPDSMEKINIFNYMNNEYKACYFGTQLEVESKWLSLPNGKEEEELWNRFSSMIRDVKVLALIALFAVKVRCPKCGKQMMFRLTDALIDYDFKCFNCGNGFDVETATGIKECINPLKFIFEAEEDKFGRES